MRGGRGERTPATSCPLFPWRLGNQERFKCNFTSATQRETQQAPQASLGRSWKGKRCSFEKTMKERASKINTLTPWRGRPQGEAACGFRNTDQGKATPGEQRAAKGPEPQKGGHRRVGPVGRYAGLRGDTCKPGRRFQVGPVVPGLLPWLPSQPYQELKARILIPTLKRGHRASQGVLVVKNPPAVQETY